MTRPIFRKPGQREHSEHRGMWMDCDHPREHRQAVPSNVSEQPDVVCLACGVYQQTVWIDAPSATEVCSGVDPCGKSDCWKCQRERLRRAAPEVGKVRCTHDCSCYAACDPACPCAAEDRNVSP